MRATPSSASRAGGGALGQREDVHGDAEGHVGLDLALVRDGDRIHAVRAGLGIAPGAREPVGRRAAAQLDVDARVEHDVIRVLDGGDPLRVGVRVDERRPVRVVGVLEVDPTAPAASTRAASSPPGRP